MAGVGAASVADPRLANRRPQHETTTHAPNNTDLIHPDRARNINERQDSAERQKRHLSSSPTASRPPPAKKQHSGVSVVNGLHDRSATPSGNPTPQSDTNSDFTARWAASNTAAGAANTVAATTKQSELDEAALSLEKIVQEEFKLQTKQAALSFDLEQRTQSAKRHENAQKRQASEYRQFKEQRAAELQQLTQDRIRLQNEFDRGVAEQRALAAKKASALQAEIRIQKEADTKSRFFEPLQNLIMQQNQTISQLQQRLKALEQGVPVMETTLAQEQQAREAALSVFQNKLSSLENKFDGSQNDLMTRQETSAKDAQAKQQELTDLRDGQKNATREMKDLAQRHSVVLIQVSGLEKRIAELEHPSHKQQLDELRKWKAAVQDQDTKSAESSTRERERIDSRLASNEQAIKVMEQHQGERYTSFETRVKGLEDREPDLHERIQPYEKLEQRVKDLEQRDGVGSKKPGEKSWSGRQFEMKGKFDEWTLLQTKAWSDQLNDQKKDWNGQFTDLKSKVDQIRATGPSASSEQVEAVVDAGFQKRIPQWNQKVIETVRSALQDIIGDTAKQHGVSIANLETSMAIMRDKFDQLEKIATQTVLSQELQTSQPNAIGGDLRSAGGFASQSGGFAFQPIVPDAQSPDPPNTIPIANKLALLEGQYRTAKQIYDNLTTDQLAQKMMNQLAPVFGDPQVLKRTVEQLNGDFNKLNQSTRNVMGTMNTQQGRLHNFEERLGPLEQGTRSVGEDLRRVKEKIQEFERTQEDCQRALGKLEASQKELERTQGDNRKLTGLRERVEKCETAQAESRGKVDAVLNLKDEMVQELSAVYDKADRNKKYAEAFLDRGFQDVKKIWELLDELLKVATRRLPPATLDGAAARYPQLDPATNGDRAR